MEPGCAPAMVGVARSTRRRRGGSHRQHGACGRDTFAPARREVRRARQVDPLREARYRPGMNVAAYRCIETDVRATRWIIASNQPCQLYNPIPEPGEAVTWSGGCVDGKASGHGRWVWRSSQMVAQEVVAARGDGDGKQDSVPPIGQGHSVSSPRARWNRSVDHTSIPSCVRKDLAPPYTSTRRTSPGSSATARKPASSPV